VTGLFELVEFESPPFPLLTYQTNPPTVTHVEVIELLIAATIPVFTKGSVIVNH
jgi:hypothetical protein